MENCGKFKQNLRIQGTNERQSLETRCACCGKKDNIEESRELYNTRKTEIRCGPLADKKPLNLILLILHLLT